MAPWFSWILGKPAKNPELQEAEETFTEDELEALRKRWHQALTQQAGGRGPPRDVDSLDTRHFGALMNPIWPCLDPLLSTQLLRLLADPSDGRVRLPALIIAQARAERLDEETALRHSFHLIDVGGEGLDLAALQAAVTSCLRVTGALPPPPTAAAAVDGAAHHGGAANTAAKGTATTAAAHVTALCRGALLFAAGDTSSTTTTTSGVDVTTVRMLYEMYSKWTKRCPSLHKTLSGLLSHVRSSGGPTGSAATASAAGGGGVLHKPNAGAEDHSPASVSGYRSAGGPIGGSAGGHSGGHPGQPGGSGDGGDGPGGPRVLPALTRLGKLPPSATLMSPVWLWALSSRLPPAQRTEWRLLFHSQRDGKSFSTLASRLTASPGPTLMLIRDAAGGVFGGYASQPWIRNGSFYGDVSCFIFSLLPAVQIFPATGINTNYQWCGLGFSQLPAGIGFGGAATSSSSTRLTSSSQSAPGGGQHFALYVDPSLETGMSRPIATYGNTPLASEQVFQIDTLECWLLQPPEEEAEQQQQAAATAAAAGAGGVLAKTAQERAFLELAGMKLHSEGLREEPLEED